ncbi:MULTISPECIES: ABC transporter ATP-binding protein [Oxalobacteraceae]|uniref:ABC transporter ATP-binding protein n=1 Tax=Herminiimonas sp. Marseille-P9896 TaxID=2742211 RepID=UPI00158B5D99|nr:MULTISPECIES: ABC transporter ATP-binding protein [Oxalobacteraceae]
MSALLEIKNLHAFYGKSHVLHGINLSIAQGEIVSLLGRNGVGRSTMVKTAMGMVEATGSIRFKGEEILGVPTYKIARKGLGYVAESREVFPTLTVAQNLLLGAQQKSRWSADDMYRLFPRLEERQHVQAGVLSGGEQQMLALCRTLMGDPDLIMIDEPTEGLAPQMVVLVANFLQELRQRGVSVLMIEQKLAIALEISQRVYVMGHGQIVFEGSPQDLQMQAAIRKEWLGV